MIPQKHKRAEKFKLRVGVFATTNVKPYFGDGGDGQAIDNRLCVFEKKTLPKKNNHVSSKYMNL